MYKQAHNTHPLLLLSSQTRTPDHYTGKIFAYVAVSPQRRQSHSNCSYGAHWVCVCGWDLPILSINDVIFTVNKIDYMCMRDGSVCLLVGCLTSQQHASVSQGQIYSDNFTGCHTEIEVADQTFHLTQSQYTDTRPTSPSTDPITPGAWQGSHWSANF